MNKYFKFAIFTMLALTITMGIVNAQTPPVGQSIQPVPFESNPQLTAKSNVGTPAGEMMMYDGDVFSAGNFYLGSGMGTTGYLEFKTFTIPSILEWDPEWVEIKMKYEVPTAATDDKYRIEYSTDGITWVVLEDNGGLKYPIFALALRPWSQLAEPQDGVWTWADIASLRFRIYCQRFGMGWDSKKMYFYEIWATVHPAPLPPASPTSVSVQPSAVTRLRPYDPVPPPPLAYYGVCFVDLYVNDVTNMYTYEMWLEFDTSVLTPLEFWTYYPWTREVAPTDLDDVNGYVRISYGMIKGTPIGEAFTGSSPFARIYFLVDVYGGGGGGGAYKGLMGTTDITIRRPWPDSLIADTEGVEITADYYNGWFSGSHYMSYMGSILPTGDPTGTRWHEIFPDYCKDWEVTDFEDTDLSGDLSTSDQIQMANASGWKYRFHVDEVTVTIWWTVKEPTLEGAAHPMEPYPLEFQETDVGWYTDPTSTYWHVIYPEDDFCRWIEITGYSDSDGDEKLSVSDQFTFYYLDEGVPYEAHLDDVTTDILVSQKPIDPEPPEMEFPLGLGLIIAIAPLIPLVYLWRRKRWEK